MRLLSNFGTRRLLPQLSSSVTPQHSQCSAAQNLEPTPQPPPPYSLDSTPVSGRPPPKPNSSGNTLPLGREKPLPSNRIHLFHKLGWYSIIVLTGGFGLLIAALIFLSFLWWSNRASMFWTWIVLQDYTSTSIALAALAIQIAVPAQAAVAVSMLASLTLEKWGSPLDQSIAISIMRYTNTGPPAALLLFSRDLKAIGGSVAFLLASALAITSTASQFSSTILLSDVSLGITRGFPEDANVTVGLSSGYDETNEYWAQGPTAYQTFAEAADSPGTWEDHADTGPSIRALLPISSETSRLQLHNYSGYATAFDSRVVCFPPVFTNTSVYWTDHIVPRFAGNVSTPNVTDIGISQPGSTTSFDCAGNAYVDYIDETRDYRILCLVQLPGLVSKVDSTVGNAYLLLRYRGMFGMSLDDPPDGWIGAASVHRPVFNHPSVKPWEVFLEGPWLNLSPSHGTNAVSKAWINSTLCLDAMSGGKAVRISATSSRNRTEPVLSSKNGTLITHGILKQLGASRERLSLEERGVLSLDRQVLETPLGKGAGTDVIPAIFGSRKGGRSVTLCPYYNSPFLGRSAGTEANRDDRNTDLYGDRRLGAIFQTAINETSDPSVALQAVLTTVARMKYYDWLWRFDLRYSATTTSFVTKSFPQRSRGITAIFATIGAHFILIFIVVLLFCTSTNFSVLDNVWSTLAQVSTSATEEILRVSTLAKDSEVEKTLKESGLGNTRVRIQRIVDTGRVGLVKV